MFPKTIIIMIRKISIAFIAFLSCFCFSAKAIRIEYEGVYYDVDTVKWEASVSNHPDYYKGSVVIPETIVYNDMNYVVTTVGLHAFYKCVDLTNVSLPNSILTIKSAAFDSCINLKTIEFPKNLDVIEFGAFRNSGLTSVELANNLRMIKDQVFKGCKDLERVTISSPNLYIDLRVFESCESLVEYKVEGDSERYSSYDGILFDREKKELMLFPLGREDTTYTVPDFVEEIGFCAFLDNSKIKRIKMNEGLKKIGIASFERCTNLRSVELNSGLKTIEYSAFWGCSSIVEMKIPNSVEYLGSNCFTDCVNLKNISFETSNVTELEYDMFENCSSLKKIILPEKTDEYNLGCFDGCDSLEWVEISADNEYFTTEDGVLYDKNKTKVLFFPFGKNRDMYVIPEGVIEIDQYSIPEIAYLKIPASLSIIKNGLYVTDGFIVDENNMTFCSDNGILFNKDKTELLLYPNKRKDNYYKIPDYVNKLGEGAFFDCNHLIEVEIPLSVTHIEESCFESCDSLKEVVLHDSVSYMGSYTFMNCISLEKVRIPKKCDKIPDWFVFGCHNLKELIVHEDVVSFGHSMAEHCYSLTEIVMPEKLKFIGDYILWECTNLKKIISFAKNPPPLSMYALQGLYGVDYKVYVPFEAVEDYRNDDYWRYRDIYGFYVIDAVSENGTVEGGGYFLPDTTITLTAIPAEGFRFVGWSDECLDNPREMVVNSDLTLTAYFEKNEATFSPKIKSEKRLMIMVANEIVVEDGVDYQVYDMKGAWLGKPKYLDKGIFLIVCEGESYKVVVK